MSAPRKLGKPASHLVPLMILSRQSASFCAALGSAGASGGRPDVFHHRRRRTASCIGGAQPFLRSRTPTGMQLDELSASTEPAAASIVVRRPASLPSWRRRALTPSLAAAILLSALLTATGALAREWHFDVSVDGFPIGTHDITLEDKGNLRSARGDMRFRVSLLGFEAGSYEQHEEETWQADCLTRIVTRTVEKGAVTTVAGRLEGGSFVIDGAGTKQRLPSCVMSFAYWNPQVLKQPKLVNVQTGAWTPINVRDLGKEAYSVRGASVDATHYRIDTARNKIDVWYSPEGEWIGLRSTSHEGHVLNYRLK